MRKIIFALVALAVFSCKAYLSKKYKFNQELHFANQEEYSDYLLKKNIQPANVLYIDSSSFIPFISKISNEGMSIFYGSFINDSLEIKKSENLKENMSCIGRVLMQIKEDSKTADHLNDSLLVKSDFNQFSFRNFSDRSLFRMSNDNTGKVNIFLIYSYKLGNYFDEAFKEALDFESKNKDAVQIKIITIDWM